MNTTSTITERPARRRSLVGPAIILAAVVILGIGVAVWWAAIGRSGGTPVTQETINQPLTTAARADVAIMMGAGTLQLDARATATQLIDGTVGRRAREQVMHDFSMIGETAHYTLRTQGEDATFVPFRRGEQDVRWDLHLNPEVPIALNVDTGAGTARLDLADLRATNVDVTTGVGTTTLTLPRRGQAQAQITGGIGTTTVLIPAGMAARIEVVAGLGSTSVEGNYVRHENVYISPDYETASNRVELRVRGGIGTITVRQIAEE